MPPHKTKLCLMRLQMNIPSKNKFGLSRYIPSEIKQQIRKDAGYGCVFCGCVLVEYEHIDPEYHNAKEHNPEKMTILCPLCHDKVTKKIISKKKVLDAKSNPKALKDGFVHDMLMVVTENLELRLGNTISSMMAIAVRLYGKPIFWFEKNVDDEFLLCAIFYGANGKAIAYINRNEYIAIIDKQDIVSKGTRLTITDPKDGVLLDLSRNGDMPLQVNKLLTQYLHTKVVIENSDSGVMFGNIDTPNQKLGGISNLTLCGQGYAPNSIQTALGLGGTPHSNFLNTVNAAIIVSIVGSPIFDFCGSIVGWRLNDKIINKNYKLVGRIEKGLVYNVLNEFVCDFNNNQLIYEYDQYKDGEPIFVISNDRFSQNAKSIKGFDLSYRFNG